MPTLESRLGTLENALDAVESAQSDQQVAEGLIPLVNDAARRKRSLEACVKSYRHEDLSGEPGARIRSDAWRMALTHVQDLRARAVTSPEALRDDTLWRNTKSSLAALVKALEVDIAARTSAIGHGREHLLDTTFLRGIPDGVAQAGRYERLATEIGQLDSSPGVLAPAEISKLARLWGELEQLRAVLDRYTVPAELRDDFTALLECRLPYERYGGPLKEYVERTGLAERVRAGLASS